MSAIFWMARLRRLAGGILLLSGFSWGVLHHPPAPTNLYAKHYVIYTQPLCDEQSFVASYKNHAYRLFGHVQQGQWVRVQPTPLRQPWPLVDLYFVKLQPDISRQGVLSTLRNNLGNHFSELGKEYSPHIQAWAQALFLGDKTYLSTRLKEVFKTLGIYHLLIISGLHVTLCAYGVTWLAMLPFRFFYALKIINPWMWIQVEPALRVGFLALLTLLVCVSGFSAASQRAFLIYLTAQMLTLFSGRYAYLGVMLRAAVLQASLFPVSFISLGNLMSWSAYIVVVDGLSGLQAMTKSKKIVALLAVQVKLALLSLAYFQNLSLIGIFLNLVLVTIFPIFFVAFIIFCAVGHHFASVAALFSAAFELMVETIETFSEHEAWFLVAFKIPSGTLRLVAAALAFAILYASLVRLAKGQRL